MNPSVGTSRRRKVERRGGLSESVEAGSAVLLPAADGGRPKAGADDSSDSSASSSDSGDEPGGADEDEDGDDSGARRSTFAGTWPRTSAPGWKEPSDMSKEEV